MFYSGQTLICIEDFSFFKKGHKYYCSHVTEEYFFVMNHTDLNVAYIKLPLALRNKFEIKI